MCLVFNHAIPAEIGHLRIFALFILLIFLRRADGISVSPAYCTRVRRSVFWEFRLDFCSPPPLTTFPTHWITRLTPMKFHMSVHQHRIIPRPAVDNPNHILLPAYMSILVPFSHNVGDLVSLDPIYPRPLHFVRSRYFHRLDGRIFCYASPIKSVHVSDFLITTCEALYCPISPKLLRTPSCLVVEMLPRCVKLFWIPIVFKIHLHLRRNYSDWAHNLEFAAVCSSL